MKEINAKCLRHIKLSQIFRQDYYFVNQKGVYYPTLVLFFSFIHLCFSYQVAIHFLLDFLEEVKYGMARTNCSFCNDSFQSERHDAKKMNKATEGN